MKAVAWAALLCALLPGGVATGAAPLPAFDHVVVIVFENKEATSVLGSRAAPTFNSYARRYAKLTRYYGVTHPSLPNYLALVSGSTQGITSDCTDCVVDAQSLANTIEASGRTWEAYAEVLPAPGFLGASRAATQRGTIRLPISATSQTTRPAARGSCRLPVWPPIFVRGHYPVFRSSFPTFATRCTTARSPSATRGSGARSGSS